VDAARFAEGSGHTELAAVVMRDLLSRDGAETAAEKVANLGDPLLVALLMRQWQAAEGRAREAEARWPACQQLLIGVATAHQQLRGAAADIRTAAVSAAVQAAGPMGSGR
jgi:hypothetical protein